MIILHDNQNSDLTHIQAMAEMEEGFALFDYVQILQNEESWIGQVIEPNRNVSTVGGPLDSTVRHGLKLMQTNSDVQSVESVQVFDILILGEYDGQQMLTPRIRPLPGAVVSKLDVETTSRVIGLPKQKQHADESYNVIGELLNADGVPLCIDARIYNHHIMIAGGTGSGKSNVAANLIEQAVKYDKCVLIHDAKPDYNLIKGKNTDSNVELIWNSFTNYGLKPSPAKNVIRIGFHGKCNPKNVDDVVGFRASDFDPAMLAGLFFVGRNEANQFEGFASAATYCYEQMDLGNIKEYSLQDILDVVSNRMNIDAAPQEQIHKLTGDAILRKVGSRQKDMPWLDSVGTVTQSANNDRISASNLGKDPTQAVQNFSLNKYVKSEHILVIDYSQMDDQSYAAILSYFLKICQTYRQKNGQFGIVQMVDEAHRIFDNESRHSNTLAGSFNRIMREGRSVDHSIILSLQNASQIPQLVMNNLNSHIVMRQNSKGEAEFATQTMGREFSTQALHLGTGHALVKMFESRAIVLVQMAPSPYELMRTDNTEVSPGKR